MVLIPPADNDYEIGEEPESTWGWNKFTGKPKRLKSSAGGRRKKGRNGDTGWLSKRKKLSSMIEHCSDVLSKAGAVGDGGGGGGTTLEEDVSSTEEEIVTEEELECGKVREVCFKVMNGLSFFFPVISVTSP